jgi:hypothetical protein
VGVAAAKAGARKVLLTDQPAQMKLLKENVALNAAEIEAAGCSSVECVPLMWGDEGALKDLLSRLDCAIDIVLAADVGYDWQLHAPLMSSLQGLCSLNIEADADTSVAPKTGAGMVLIAEEKRWSDIYGWFTDALHETFDTAGTSIFEAPAGVDLDVESAATDIAAESPKPPAASRVTELVLPPITATSKTKVVLLSVTL